MVSEPVILITYKEIAISLSNKGAWIVTLPSGNKYHTMIVTKIEGTEVFVLDPWPVNGLTGIGKSKEGVEAVMDFDYFVELWHSAHYHFAQVLD